MLEKLTINKKLLKELDFGIIISSVIIVVFGAMNIYSAQNYLGENWSMYFMKTQFKWLALSLIVLYVILLVDYSVIQGYANVIYWTGIILLIINDTIFSKDVVNGAASWIRIGKVGFQPSEFAKLGMIIMIAKKLDDMEGNINNLKNFFILFFYAVLPMILILIQPDMGMTMVCFFIVLGIFFAAGLNLKVIFGGITSIAVLIVAVWNSSLMPTYWKNRFLSVLDPEKDELGLGMQVINSLTSIGSGGVLGYGFLKGDYVKGGMVPEAFTDFIFSVVGNEWGLIGGILLLILYSIILIKVINISKNSKDIFGSMVSIGVFSSFLFSIFQNIGMNIKFLPITGITLPFMSYGGSSLMTNFMALGLVLNIGMRRKKINF